MDEVDTDHALLCVQNYPDRKDREQCCAPVPDYLKDLCMEGKPPLDKLLGGDGISDEKAKEVCESLSSLPPKPISDGSYRMSFDEDLEVFMLECHFAKEEGHGLYAQIQHGPEKIIQVRWDQILEDCEDGEAFFIEYDVTRCGQDEVFGSDPDYVLSLINKFRANFLFRQPTPGTLIQVREVDCPSPEISDLMQDLMDAAEDWVTGRTLTLGEVSGEE
jgi:hypothetical protein